MTRYKAFAIHLSISLAVIGTIVAAVFLLWYPRGLWRVAGLDHLFLVMLGIDIVAGPLLTLIVYNKAKPELHRDLAIVVLLQMAFLGYGLHTTWQSRPIFVVGAVDAFDLVFANEISDADLAQATQPRWKHRSWTGPQLVGARMPTDSKARSGVMDRFLKDGTGIERLPMYFVDYAKVAPELLRKARPVQGSTTSDRAIAASNRPRERLRWLPIASIRANGAMLLDATTGEPVYTTGENPLLNP